MSLEIQVYFEQKQPHHESTSPGIMHVSNRLLILLINSSYKRGCHRGWADALRDDFNADETTVVKKMLQVFDIQNRSVWPFFFNGTPVYGNTVLINFLNVHSCISKNEWDRICFLFYNICTHICINAWIILIYWCRRLRISIVSRGGWFWSCLFRTTCWLLKD